MPNTHDPKHSMPIWLDGIEFILMFVAALVCYIVGQYVYYQIYIWYCEDGMSRLYDYWCGVFSP